MRQTKKMVIAGHVRRAGLRGNHGNPHPTPGTGGYIHPGDAVVILCGIFLNPGAAFLAAGMGSAMADLLGGYFLYVPITFVIKGLVAFLAGHAFRRLSRASKKPHGCGCNLRSDRCGPGGGRILFLRELYLRAQPRPLPAYRRT